jgi:hypothetical protein
MMASGSRRQARRATQDIDFPPETCCFAEE